MIRFYGFSRWDCTGLKNMSSGNRTEILLFSDDSQFFHGPMMDEDELSKITVKGEKFNFPRILTLGLMVMRFNSISHESRSPLNNPWNKYECSRLHVNVQGSRTSCYIKSSASITIQFSNSNFLNSQVTVLH